MLVYLLCLLIMFCLKDAVQHDHYIHDLVLFGLLSFISVYYVRNLFQFFCLNIIRYNLVMATYFRFSFRWFKKGSCQLLAKVCA